MLQLYRIDEGQDYAEFSHLPRRKFSDFGVYIMLQITLLLINMKIVHPRKYSE